MVSHYEVPEGGSAQEVGEGAKVTPESQELVDRLRANETMCDDCRGMGLIAIGNAPGEPQSMECSKCGGMGVYTIDLELEAADHIERQDATIRELREDQLHKAATIVRLREALAAWRDEQNEESLRELAHQFQWWLDYHEQMWAKEGKVPEDSYHVMNNGYENAPPCWPSRSVLKEWIHILRNNPLPQPPQEG